MGKTAQEYEAEYGLRLTAEQVRQLTALEEDKAKCLKCDGKGCAKTTNMWRLMRAEVEMGRLYFRDEECPYAAERRLIQRSIEVGVPRRYASLTYEDYEETPDNAESIKMSRHYVETRANSSVYLYGECGVGKTFLASIMAKGLIKRGVSVVFTDIGMILARLQNSFNDKSISTEKIFREYVEAGILILDDLGAVSLGETKSQWGISQLYRLVNERYNTGRHMIITSNYDYDGLREVLSRYNESIGYRIVSRLVEMCGEYVGFLGGDDRRLYA